MCLCAGGSRMVSCPQTLVVTTAQDSGSSFQASGCVLHDSCDWGTVSTVSTGHMLLCLERSLLAGMLASDL